VEIEEFVSIETGVNSFEEDFYTSDELYKVLNDLPAGYRMIFNLYAIEGYKHKEIAEILGIDTNTSKSQYSRAKAAIRDKLEKLGRIKNNYSADDL
jgi:RNA polymerase sigma-70 factor (ECF subfamily)